MKTGYDDYGNGISGEINGDEASNHANVTEEGESEIEFNKSKGIGDYIALADEATDEVVAAYDALSKCIADYALAKDQLLAMKHLIEDKKNRMIATGEIVGKNAEERAANAWIAITEYDDLVVLESNVNTARANYEIAKTKLSAWQYRVGFYRQMIDVLVQNATDFLDDNGWVADDYREDPVSWTLFND